MRKQENYPKHSSNVNNEIAIKNREYIQKWLNIYIQENASYIRSIFPHYGWHIEPDFNTRIKIMLLDYILENFTLYELWVIFFQYQETFILEREEVKLSKQDAIESINDDERLTPQEKKRLKRKVWDMNLLLFGLLNEFLQYSSLFLDQESGEYVFPDFAFN
jgi:hypothetical protein